MSFKVICIDNSHALYTKKHIDLDLGETYTVISEVSDPASGILHYVLSERRHDKAYGAFRFIPLSEIDETTFERNYNKELV